MKVLVLGAGGREHALAWRLGRDPDVSGVVSAPGNPGMAAVGRCVSVDPNDPAAVLALVEREAIDLTIVGPEAPLERGVADRLRDAGWPVVGPSERAAALECSKAFAKAFMARHGIPTARFVVSRTVEAALDAVAGPTFGFPVVVKADGLAGGKGVTVAETRAEAEAAVRAAMAERRFGSAGERLVIEECLTGPEVSFFVLTDGRRAVPLGSAEDHKRLADGDRGPNTGGMGALAPSPRLSAPLSRAIMQNIVDPVLAGMRAEEAPYSGFLYVSLMLTPEGPKVIEFNVRFGDPEAEVIMPLVEGRIARLLHAAARGSLGETDVSMGTDVAVGIVLASRGYPVSSDAGRPISGVEDAARMAGVQVFHAGTRLADGRLVTAGGRVLAVVGVGRSYEAAMTRAYDAVGRIQFDGMQYRRDIGRKAIGVRMAV
jgi:phosphoribosylamine--glycine ligase